MMNVFVYKLDGTLQCGWGNEISLQEMHQELATLIGEQNILAEQKARVPLAFPRMCGAPTGMANVYEITEEGALILFKGIVGSAGFLLWIWAPPSEKANLMGGQDTPLPLGLRGASADDSAVILAFLSTLTQAGALPTTINELIGRKSRYYRRGDPLTLDYWPNRVNIEHDDHYVILRIWFG